MTIGNMAMGEFTKMLNYAFRLHMTRGIPAHFEGRLMQLEYYYRKY